MSRAQSAPRVEPDVQFSDEGPYALAKPLTAAGKRWMRRYLTGETSWHERAVVVEPRYLEDLVLAMRGAGLVVRG